MISFFVIVGTTAKLLNLRLKKRREALLKQQELMGQNVSRVTCPDEVEARQHSEA